MEARGPACYCPQGDGPWGPGHSELQLAGWGVSSASGPRAGGGEPHWGAPSQALPVPASSPASTHSAPCHHQSPGRWPHSQEEPVLLPLVATPQDSDGPAQGPWGPFWKGCVPNTVSPGQRELSRGVPSHALPWAGGACDPDITLKCLVTIEAQLQCHPFQEAFLICGRAAPPRAPLWDRDAG